MGIRILIFALLFCQYSALAQRDSVPEVTGVVGSYHPICRRLSNEITGDSSLAILSSHHKLYSGVVAQLGYVDTTSADLDEVLNNLKLGLLVFPQNNDEVCSFCISWINKGVDPVGPICFQGNKIANSYQVDFYRALRAKTVIEFTNIRMRKRGATTTMPLPSFWIKVR